MTTKEAMQALLEGKKIVCRWIKETKYVYLGEDGGIKNNYGIDSWYDSSDDHELYEEPKKTKTVWQWRYRAPGDKWSIYLVLLSEQEAKEYFYGDIESAQMSGPHEVEE